MPITLAAVAADARTDFAPIPPGTYNATIFDITIQENKAHDGYYLKVFCALQDEGYVNRRVSGNVSLKPTARWKLNEFLRSIGFSKEDLSKEIKIFDKNEEAPGDLDNTVCPVFLALLLDDVELRVEVTNEQNGDKTYSVVDRWVAPPDAYVPTTAAEDVPF
jgi:hypothetical protein